MACIFHRWSVWSKPEFKSVRTTISSIYHFEEKVSSRKQLIQERTCKNCGKYQWQLVECK